MKQEIVRIHDIIKQGGINLHQWGTGNAKDLQSLFYELLRRESTLSLSKDTVVRRTVIAVANVCHETETGENYRLIEQWQRFHDGRIRIRKHVWSVVEKIKLYEEPTSAIRRGIGEELGIPGEDIALIHLGKAEETKSSESYPGLTTKATIYKFKIMLNSVQFNPNGYLELQDDKVSYFGWVKE